MFFIVAIRRFLGLGLVLGMSLVADGQLALQTIEFQPSNADFVNPERGFMRFRDLTSPSGFHQVRPGGDSLIYGRILADDFRSGPLSPQFLDQVQAGFDLARTEGLKVKPRVVYNNGFAPDAPKSVILGHIQQLKPIWEANQDVISHLDAGFIGAWGEWHGSTNGLDNNTDRSEILFAILDALPQDRMVGIRTPHFKREIFSGSQTSDAAVITPAIAFDKSDLARVGHLNDCFLSSPTDFGTYAHTLNGWSRDREIGYIGGESRYAPFGGETCALHALGESANTLDEMERLHIDYLNRDYNQDVLQRWKDEGSFDEISRRLGYRFELQTAELAAGVKPSGLMEIRLDIRNVGFGELFNPRKVEITLENNATGEITSAPLQLDPRLWTGGSTHQVHTHLAIPATIAQGTYSVGLWMPDLQDSLRNDLRYAIRFGNADVWDGATGINQLKTNLVISPLIEGPTYVNLVEFAEVPDPSQLLVIPPGDYDQDGDVDVQDHGVWNETFGWAGVNLAADGDRDGIITSADYTVWRDHLGSGPIPVAVPEPKTLLWLLFAGPTGILSIRHLANPR